MSWLKRWFERKPRRAAIIRDEPDTADAFLGCSHDQAEFEHRMGTPDFDLFVAEGELEVGKDLQHGAHHLAWLLFVDPAQPGWRGLADSYSRKAGSGLDRLIPESEKRYVASEALRAYFWQARGGDVDAISRLVSVTGNMDDKRYLDAWVCGWLEAPGAVEALPADLALGLFANAVTKAPEPHRASLKEIRTARRWADLVLRASGDAASSGPMMMFKVGVLRKAARYEEALALAGPLALCDENTAMARGLVLRRLGRPEESEAAFARSLELAPGNLSAFLENGDTWFDIARWDRALHWYEKALATDAEQVWAKPSALFCLWKLQGEERLFEAFFALAKEGNGRARWIWYENFGALPEYADATSNVWRQIRSELAKNGGEKPEDAPFKIKLALSAMEAPSNRLAIMLDCAAAGRTPTMDIHVEAIPTPDPRQPIAPVDHLIWRYQDRTPIPVLDPPSEAIATRIAAMARLPFLLEANCAQASFAADEFGTGAVRDLLAVMVHPPAVPEDNHGLAWVPRIQLAAALVLAQIDEGWEASHRRGALLSMLFGPSDWITGAAIRALAWIARTEQAYAMDIHEQFAFLERHIPDIGGCCWADILYEQWEGMPFQTDTEKQRYARKLEEWRA